MTYKQKGVCPDEGKDAFVFYRFLKKKLKKNRHAVVRNFNHNNLILKSLAVLN